jgi:hypothetical protein
METRRRRQLAKIVTLLGCSALGLLTAGFIGYGIGGYLGFLDGFLAGSVVTGATDGHMSTSALKALRNGQTEQGVSLLETSLDGNVVDYWLYLQSGDSVFDRSRVASKSRRAIQQIAEYREAFPATIRTEDLWIAVRNALRNASSDQDTDRRETGTNLQGGSGR